MQGIEEMARELVKTYPFLSDDKAQLSSRSASNLANAPAAALPSMRERKTITALTKSAALPCGKTTAFSRNGK